MTDNVNKSSIVASEIAKDISEVNDSSNRISNDSLLVKTSADELKHLSEKLKDAVEKFKI